MTGRQRTGRARKAELFIKLSGWFVMGGALALAFFWYFKPSVIRVSLWQAACYVGGVIILILIAKLVKPFKTTFNPVAQAAFYVPTVRGTCVRYTIITALIVFGWSGETEYTAPIHPSGTLVVGVLQFLWWIISLVCLIIRAVVANRIPEYVARDRSDALSFGGHSPSSQPVSSANNQSFDFSDTSPRLSPDPEPASLPPTDSHDVEPEDFDPYLDVPHPSPAEPQQTKPEPPETKQPEKPQPQSPTYSQEQSGVPAFGAQLNFNHTGSQRSAAYGSGPAGAHTGSGPTRSGNTSGTLNCPQCNAPKPAYMHLCPACADASGRH